ncbi:class I SAM-dependent methyltransferase [Nocardioides sp. BP30]|uniref:class I SAM-dependent methyltransferase n=1 Tax=Nocardioides sp. BP30 TaxID=3036374 RepID=UPI002469B7AD|nr:class I SAM-dependent methyltransferase [Nocardioides sp. BP30]WGL52407.1 class I SAM-dependent methyltransferase [Nocardioides sp. BP30]
MSDAEGFWNERYAERERIWSGHPNKALVDTVSPLAPGRALDLGCGEGADSIWLAEQGWTVTGVDVAETAVGRARAESEHRDLPITWVAADLTEWAPSEDYDLVSACFLHSPVEFPRTEVLRRLAGSIVSGGHLLVVGHAEPPPWSRYAEAEADSDGHDGHDGHEGHEGHRHEHVFLGPEQELETLDLGEDWEPLTVELRERPATGPDGEQAILRDSVVLLRRR